MAKFTLEIACDNAAFGEGEKRADTLAEVGCILRKLSERFEQTEYDNVKLRDTNGNKVGRWHMDWTQT